MLTALSVRPCCKLNLPGWRDDIRLVAGMQDDASPSTWTIALRRRNETHLLMLAGSTRSRGAAGAFRCSRAAGASLRYCTRLLNEGVPLRFSAAAAAIRTRGVPTRIA